MKGLSTFILVAGLWSTYTEGLTFEKRTDGPARVVGFPMARKSIEDPVKRDRLRRRGTVTVVLDNQQTLYFANATLGTPPQIQRLHIDTGSSDLWVNAKTSALCKGKEGACDFAGAYSANDSSTYSYIGSHFNISYVDGSGASGDYVSDTFSIGSTTLKRLQFGIGYTSSSPEGILGIGYEVNEVQVGRAGKGTYLNLPAQLKADGFITSNAYSLWLNDLSASTGSILFGGIDTEQFEGTLQTLPVQRESNTFAEFLITLTDINIGSHVIAQKQAQAVLLDSGSSLTYLPDVMTEAIYAQVGAQYDSSQGAAYVPCSLADNTSTIDFTFSGPTIKVPMNELVIFIASTSGRPLTFSDGSRACIFGIAPAGSASAVMGDTFIRSAYLVYDLDNNQISIAQTKFNATTHNIVEITSGKNSVPKAQTVPNPVAASSTPNHAHISGSTDSNKPKNAAIANAPSAKLGFMSTLLTLSVFFAAL
ncbi:hypothetical protein HYFRA_00009111 [Hymenoscyphus fraxineus]|uniref:Probable aspartic-type endopeptidase OPSB n=1 Tax=Hymenoscyphus fraxineus TaxID=746836 RepID=A0A9N9KYW6_9HELO|nr:hypothetical protein HYFRA_00009111 [Hymenoscyphus fraxineus]